MECDPKGMKNPKGLKAAKAGYTWTVPADLEQQLNEVVEANKPFASRSSVMRLAVAQGLAVLKEAKNPR